MKPSILLRSLFPVLFVLAMFACNNDPKITITAIDCPADSIRIVDTSRLVNQPGNQCKLSCAITIYCGSNTVSNAEISISLDGGDPQKLTTNQQGKATYAKNFGVACGKYNLEVEVKGSDKSTTRTITLQ